MAVQQTLEQEALTEEQLRTRRHVLVEVREVPPRQGARALPSNPRNIRRRLPSETPQPRHGEHPRRGTLEGLRAGGALQERVARLVGQDQPLPVRLVLAAGPFLRRERVWHPRHHPKVRLGEELARRRGTGVREASLPSRSHHGDCRADDSASKPQQDLHFALPPNSCRLLGGIYGSIVVRPAPGGLSCRSMVDLPC